jgi:hypothetical protein
MVMEAVASLPDDDDTADPDADAGNQLSLDDFVKPADWPEGKNWGTLTIDASCVPADITYPTDLKLLNEARESTERIIDDLCDQRSDLRQHRPRYDHGAARANFLSVALAEGFCAAVAEEATSPQDKTHDTASVRLPAAKS